MNTPDLSCQELVELITDYLEGALSLAERERFEKHMGRCRACWGYLQQMRETVRLAGKLTEETITPPVRDELLDVFRKWKQK